MKFNTFFSLSLLMSFCLSCGSVNFLGDSSFFGGKDVLTTPNSIGPSQTSAKAANDDSSSTEEILVASSYPRNDIKSSTTDTQGSGAIQNSSGNVGGTSSNGSNGNTGGSNGSVGGAGNSGGSNTPQIGAGGGSCRNIACTNPQLFQMKQANSDAEFELYLLQCRSSCGDQCIATACATTL